MVCPLQAMLERYLTGTTELSTRSPFAWVSPRAEDVEGFLSACDPNVCPDDAPQPSLDTDSCAQAIFEFATVSGHRQKRASRMIAVTVELAPRLC